MSEQTESQVDEGVDTSGEAELPESDRLYTPAPGEAQFTLRAVVVGCMLGAIVTGMNLYLGLKIGWSVGGSLMAAILAFSFFSVLGKSLSVLETNIAQTAGSGAGSMASAAGMLAPIPAMFLLAKESGDFVPPNWWQLYLWSFAIAYLGVNFAVPLRRQYVVIEKLRFPTGTATANTILAMFAKADEAVEKARYLVYIGIAAGGFMLLNHFMPWIAGQLGWENLVSLEQPPVHKWLGVGAIATAAAWGFKVYIGPMMVGVGLLIGPRVGLSLLLGAIIGWAFLGPWAQDMGWAPEAIMSYQKEGVWGPRGWILWPGVAIMVAEALTALALSWRTFLAAFKRLPDSNLPEAQADTGQDIPNKWWIGVLILGAIFTVVIAQFVFGIEFYLTILAIALSAILANVAVRSTGETDINPIGGMGKVTQLAFGVMSPSMIVNLQMANVTGAGASQAADMMQDLKTGHMVGASPRKQYLSQLIGIGAGVAVVVPLFFLFLPQIGTEQLPAPAAMAWKAVAEVLSKGLDTLPPMAIEAGIGGLVVGAALPILRTAVPTVGRYLPNGLAMGIAIIVPAYYSVTMAIGSLLLVYWQRANKESCERLVYAVAAGLIAGEGLIGIVNAILTMFGIPG